jgi:hemolysin activation/secretion protein
MTIDSKAQDAGALQRQLKDQIERSSPGADIQSTKPTEKKEINLNEQKVEIKGYRFKGNTLVDSAVLQELTKSWANRPVAFSELNDMTVLIQEFYAKQGRLAKANIPQQDLTDGTILIEIIEAKLGIVSVVPKDTSALRIDPEIAKKYISNNNESGQFIDSNSLERSMMLLNELPGVQTNGDFVAGNIPGETNFNVNLADGPLFSGQVAFSNFGSPSTGVMQGIANLSLNDPSGIGDQVTLDAIQSQGSTFAQLGYSMPIGYDGLRIGLQGSNLQYSTLNDWSSNKSDGTAKTLGANINYALLREQSSNSNLRLGIETRGYNNNIDGQNLSDYNINALSVNINGNIFDTNISIINYSATITSGSLRINNPTQAIQDLSGPGTEGNYIKLGFNLSRNQQLSFLPNTTWIISANGQLSNRNLNSSEQIYMGGPYAVRAYPVAQGGGSSGLIISTELQHRLDTNWQVGAFADFGFIQQYVDTYTNWQGLTNANNSYQLGALGPTIKYSYENLSINGILAFRLGDNPLYNSSGLQLNADNAYRTVQAWLRASYIF